MTERVETPLVRTSVDGDVGTLTLDNPGKRNALSRALIDAALAAFDAFEVARVRAVILRASAGVTVWSAGHDVAELPETGDDPVAFNVPLERLLRRVQDLPAPVIAMVEGSVWGGACDLCMACDVIVGADNASFAMTPVKLGIPYNPSGIQHFVSVLGLHKVKEMFFTAEPVAADEALRIGLMNHRVPRAELEAFTQALAARITRNSPLAVAAIKQELRLLTRGTPLAAETFEEIQSLRRRVWGSEDYREGLRAFREKRPPRFPGR